jgi:hypothetical protein
LSNINRMGGRKTGGIILAALLWFTTNMSANVCVYKPPHVRHICGVVVDRYGEPIEGAQVTVQENGTPVGVKQTKADGGFDFPSLEAGEYEIQVSADNFTSGNYKIFLSRPAKTCKRILRIQLAIGGEDCPGDIAVVKKAARKE